jgi:quinol-cytochrome oxidoreductase complex cytochrome b subunit
MSALFRGKSPGGLPFCNRHQSYWTRRAWFIIGGWLFLIASMVAGILLTLMAKPDPPPHWTFTVAVCWLFLFLPAFLVVHLASIRPVAISRESITLAGASQKFASALQAEH